MKFLEKVRKLGKRAKIAISTAIATMSMSVIACVASASETPNTGSTGFNMTTAINTAGESIQNQFGAFVTTLIPILIGILMSGLGIYAVFSLIKYAKKIFGHVAG